MISTSLHIAKLKYGCIKELPKRKNYKKIRYSYNRYLLSECGKIFLNPPTLAVQCPQYNVSMSRDFTLLCIKVPSSQNLAKYKSKSRTQKNIHNTNFEVSVFSTVWSSYKIIKKKRLPN